MLDRYASSLHEEGREVFVERLPAPAERMLMESRLAVVKASLVPASMSMAACERIGAAVATLLTTYFNARSDDPKGTVAAFVVYLRDLPAWAVEEACLKIGRGQVPRIKREFPASAASIHEVATELMENTLREGDKLMRVLRAKEDTRKRAEPTEADKARVRASLEAFKAKMGDAIGADERRMQARREQSERTTQKQTTAQMEREYAAAGLKPYVAEGLGMISLSLAKSLGVALEKRGEAQ